MAFLNNPRRAKGDGVGEERPELLEADSMSFKKGELVYSNAGAITNCADDAVVILGIAKKDATNVTSGNIAIPVEIINPNDLYLMRVIDTAGGTIGTGTDAALHTGYGVEVTSNVWSLCIDEVTADAVSVYKYHYDAAGDATAWVYVRFLDTVCQAYTGA